MSKQAKNNNKNNGAGGALSEEILKIVYGDVSEIEQQPDLLWGTLVDKAHIVMLEKQSLMDVKVAISLLGAINELREKNFKPLLSMSFQRGIYIAYEDYLGERVGADVSGALHSGRSRNDLFSTVFRLQTRHLYNRVMPLIFRLNDKLCRLGHAYKDSLCVVHTQLQPAMFGTYGHFFSGVASALIQHTGQIQNAYELNEQNPLGSGAAVGTSLSIDPKITTELLGFDDGVGNSLQGVAHYEFVIDMAASLLSYATVLSRLSTTLHIGASLEFGFVRFKDGAVGRSSMLPQKNNPFLLEILNARISELSGVLTSMITGLTRIPFSNAIESKSAAKILWLFLEKFEDVVTLGMFILDNIVLDSDSVIEKEIYKNCKSLYFVERKIQQDGVVFRQSYNEISEMLSDGSLELDGVAISDVVNAFDFGGGPSSKSVLEYLKVIEKHNDDHIAYWGKRQKKWDYAMAKLEKKERDLKI